MNPLTFREIPETDSRQLCTLIDVVIASLERPEYFIPFADWEYEQFFDATYGAIHGAYDGARLVGMSQLYFSERLICDSRVILGLRQSECCELGGNLVLPEYRGRGIMFALGSIQVQEARALGFRDVFALAHPDNVGSVSSLLKLGFLFSGLHAMSDVYVRNFYRLRLAR